MKAYPLNAIQIAPDRQRQEFEPNALEELKSSIEGKRLQHAPVVRETPEGPVLVAGERRLRVIQDIFALGGSFFYDGVQYTDTVPTVTLGELDPLEAEEAELDENLRRKDLTWQELAKAHERLHKLRQAQKMAEVLRHAEVAGATITPEVIDANRQTTADTAREVFPQTKDAPAGEMGYYQDVVRKELIVSKHLDKPEVAKAKSLDEAWKILKRSEAADANRELAAKVGASFTAELHKAINENCIVWMRDQITIAPEHRQLYDVILTDPPYGMGADQFGNGGKDLPDHQYKDDYASWKPLMGEWAYLAYELTKPQAHAYVFCDIDRFHELKRYMEQAGWYVFRTPLIDYKTDSGRVPLPDRGPRRQWEMILYAIKGDKPVTHIYPDVIPCQADENMTHGAQKPVALYVNLLKRSVKPGDSVLDTFSGSGTIFPAAHSLQCVATGVEQEANYYGMGLRRLQTLKEANDPMAGLAELDGLK